ncbi:hypothetical protein BH10PSE7_BH10PSE7_44740 [soil metagenome]
MKRVIASIALFLVMSGAADAQHQHGNAPYTGLQQRPIKALSDEQLADLRSGRGMGFALAGELNGYPGPSHVLELADQLQLGPEVRQSVRALFDAMKAEAMPAGETLIARERALDAAFAARTISPETWRR